MLRTVLVAAAAIAVAGLGYAQAGEERMPTAAELAKIEDALKAAGYVSWDEIELERGGWEIDDARDADGNQYDLMLNPDTLEIISKQKED